MTESKSNVVEREYIIPLRDKCRPVPRYKKTPKAVKTVKEFLVRHMKVRDGDLNKIKLDMHLNEALWHRGIKNPIHKIKVKAIKEGDIVRVYPVDLPTSIHYKKLRMEKNSKIQKEVAKKAQKKAEEQKKTEEESVKKEIEESGVDKETAAKEAKLDIEESKKPEEKKKDLKEKADAVEELAQKEAKEEAKAIKKTTKNKTAEEKGKIAESQK
jgi:large subunit ribosomal protein L31e